MTPGKGPSTNAVDTSIIAPALREHHVRPPDTIAIFASGSMVRGWRNEMSDLDVHVVTERVYESSIGERAHVALDPHTVQFEQIFVDGLRWDIEYWSQSQIDQLLEKVSWKSYENPNAPWATASRTEMGMLQRLPYAVEADGGGWLEDVQRRLRESAHRTILIGISLRVADGFVEDAAGQLEARDYHSAVLAARIAFEHSVDALQASLGQIGSLWPKWRARRMSLVESPVLTFDQYWQVETMATYREDDPAEWITETLDLCRRISMNLDV